ncbi:hypothetical protein [Hydrogenophaga sp.]|uniref:hypothetical protein n=1 Tax=Hydrogenophaga sp. TaxID=1904254 RepID=UPI00276E6D17|nr:hypothetical protein [Hydrogenophaga sp.]MDP2418764.1 hypothetical protein [Hydrogenophaga sp.]
MFLAREVVKKLRIFSATSLLPRIILNFECIESHPLSDLPSDRLTESAFSCGLNSTKPIRRLDRVFGIGSNTDLARKTLQVLLLAENRLLIDPELLKKKRFDGVGLIIPFPQRGVHVHTMTG